MGREDFTEYTVGKALSSPIYRVGLGARPQTEWKRGVEKTKYLRFCGLDS